MMSGAIEALYIFNAHTNEPLLDHVYRSRPAPSRVLLPLYLAHSKPRPSMIFLPNVNPATTLFSLLHTNVLFLVPASTDTEPLFVLEFLNRLADALEEFLGSPLLAGKIESSYDVVAQLLGEMCDAGNVCNTEPNALRDVVNMPGWVDKLLGGVGLPGSTPTVASSNSLRQQLALKPTNAAPAIPWRRANVKHTSNELYVDIVETLSVTLAPSGRPLAAFANGSVLFTSKISGVPDLVLNLTVPSGKHTVDRVIELPTFHPCVRLARWKEKPGELSFIPPDGKFLLAGYQVNLLPTEEITSQSTKNLNLPAFIEVQTSLGPTGLEFEARIILKSVLGAAPGSASTSQARIGFGGGGSGSGSGRSTPSLFDGIRAGGLGSSGASSGPTLGEVVATIPMPKAVRNLTDLRASRGEATFSSLDQAVTWRIPSKEAAVPGTATLRCTVVGALSDDDDEDEEAEDDAADGAGGGGRGRFALGVNANEYDPDADGEVISGAYQSTPMYSPPTKPKAIPPPSDNNSNKKTSKKSSSPSNVDNSNNSRRDVRKAALHAALMPTSASLSFGVKGWTASGLRVESLNVDPRRSRGLGEGVKPVKGVKYLTVSKGGVETRC